MSLVQADNFSWFGYPDDTELSARNFFPGLAKVLLASLLFVQIFSSPLPA